MEKKKKFKRRLRGYIPVIGKSFLILIASAIIVSIFPNKPNFQYEFTKDTHWKNANLYSPFDFLIQKSNQEIEKEIENIKKNHKPYFNIIGDEFENIKELERLSQEDDVILIKDNYAIETKVKDIKEGVEYNKEKTEISLQNQLNDIIHTKGLIKKGDLIIAKDEKIDEEKFQILNSLKTEYEGVNNTEKVKFTLLLGQFILIVIAISAMFLFFKHINKEIYEENRKIIFILSVIIMMVALTALIIKLNPNYIYITPLCLTPIIIRTFFNSRAALYVFLVSIIIIGFSVPNSFEFVFYQLIVGMMSIISMENLENRAGFFKLSVIIFITYSIIYIAITLIHDNDIKNIDFYRFAHFAMNATLTLFAFPLIFLMEKLFGFVSEITLMEYSNTNSKILRELSIKAPGTFQHCVQVANISEELVHEIGGNALLARVGALHHDIGKIMMPSFFIENQNTGFNPHTEISYEESAKVITDHVLDGIKLAHRSKLPEQIVDFIRTHHGTSKTRFFYNKQKQEHPDQPLDEDLFTYRGPKPFTKETAVVMMVDSVEAASRSLKVYTEKSIGDLVDNIIDIQIKEDQFSNAEITFKDIDTIKDFLKHKLQSIYHTRIEYPLNN
ncbi:MAG: HDIG domain-containing protein [Bacteroidales bacterium]|nr:HDIG domain-containing protein [Bacteroidales bacterium]